MKKIFALVFAIAMFLFKSVNAQEGPKMLTVGTDGLYSYEHVFDAPGKTKDQIFVAIKNWVIKNVITQSNTNYFDEAEKKTVSTATAFSVYGNGTVIFKMNIDIKDGKYKLTANSFTWVTMYGMQKDLGDFSHITVHKKSKQKIYDDVDENFSKIIASIENSVKNNTGKSDW